MEKEFKYNAFISYRHDDLDKYVAENLHRLIETYKMPKPVVEKYHITDNNFRRVFRDQEELPLASNLENPIIEALQESQFLIVICSPRLKESVWCRKEIENFIKFHGRNNILCVLVEGEPKDSFPEELMFYEEDSKKIPCEPLAMDVRGINKKEIYINLKKELIRVIAPMYHLDYDDIKRRHEERKLKKKIRIFEIVTIVSIIFAIYSAILFIKIYLSSKQLKYDQAINLANLSNELLEKDNRNGALEKAYQSVTEYNNIKLPVTSKGIYELTEALGIYYTKDYFYPLSQLDTIGRVESIKTDLSQRYLLSYDNSGEIVLWNLANETRIKTVTDIPEIIRENSYTFIGNKAFAYQNNNKEVVILDLKGREIEKISSDFFANSISSSENGKYLEVSTREKILIYETDMYTEIASYEVSSDMSIVDNNRYFDENEENLLFAISKKSSETTNTLEILTYNITNKNVVNSTNINADNVVKIIFKDNYALVISNRKIGLSFDMLVTSYNYKDGKVNFEKEYYGKYALDIKINNDTFLAVAYDTAYLIDFSGNEKAEFSLANSEVNVYTLPNANMYLVFSSNGTINVLDANENGLNASDNNTVYGDVFNFNLSSYEAFLYVNGKIVTYTSNDDRIVIYGNLENKDIKEIQYEEKEFNKLTFSEQKKIIEKYNFKKKNLISEVFYSNDNKLLFVTYLDCILEIYDNDSKELLNSIKGTSHIASLNYYIGKTKNNEYIISGYGGGYILNKDFELIAYVPKLYDYKDGKLILKTDLKYYEVKMYTEEELINIAKNKINKRK